MFQLEISLYDFCNRVEFTNSLAHKNWENTCTNLWTVAEAHRSFTIDTQQNVAMM